MSIRLCWATHSTGLGGAERALVELLGVALSEGLVERALVVAPDDRGPLHGLLARLDRVEVTVSPMASWMTREPRSRARAWRRHAKNRLVARRLGPTLQRFRADLAVTNTITIPSLAFAARSVGIPHRWFAHESGELHHLHLGLRTWQLMESLGDGLIASSRTLAGQLLRSVALPSQVVYPMVLPDTPAPRRAAGATRSVLLVGDGRPEKGLREAIRALGDAASETSVEVTIVGARDDAAALEAELVVAGLDRARVVPHASDLGDHYRRTDLVICPSRSETFGRVMAEAIWNGCSVLGNDLAVWREWVPTESATLLDTTRHEEFVAGLRAILKGRPSGSGRDELGRLLGSRAASHRMSKALALPWGNSR